MITVTEFESPAVCTATIYSTMETGESYTGPASIGHYPASDVWIEREGQRVVISLEELPTVIKQLKRAAALATKEAAHGK